MRLIVPGLYGIKNVKWLTKLTVSGDDYRGFWQDRGWTDEGIIKTQSQIRVPRRREVLSVGRHEIGGLAFAGDRGISMVEVSIDGGDTWREAEIAANPSDAYCDLDVLVGAAQGERGAVGRRMARETSRRRRRPRRCPTAPAAITASLSS